MVEAATMDCHDDSEAITGWLTMLEENLAVPFATEVLGVPVLVKRLDLDPNELIVAVCVRGRKRLRIAILELALPTPRPDGAAWIEAYCGGGGRPSASLDFGLGSPHVPERTLGSPRLVRLASGLPALPATQEDLRRMAGS
jgi:hypothetical protein